jgi:hypothetical protein
MKFLIALWKADGSVFEPRERYLELVFSIRGAPFVLALYFLLIYKFDRLLLNLDAICFLLVSALALFLFYCVVFACRLLWKIGEVRKDLTSRP